MKTMCDAATDDEIKSLKARLDYDPNTGEILWKNGKRKNCVAGSINNHGYVYLKVRGRVYKCHRLAFLLTYGRWPRVVDHINGIRSDNRIENLREVSQSQNRMNARPRSDNTSGHTGVKWKTSHEKWCAEIKVNGRIITIGYFADKQAAVVARRDAEIKHFGECGYTTSRTPIDTIDQIQ